MRQTTRRWARTVLPALLGLATPPAQPPPPSVPRPGGVRIAFASREGIATMRADGSDVTLLARHDFRDDRYEPSDMGVGKPAWSPDGNRIAFEHRGDGEMMPAHIFVILAGGSRPAQLTLPNGSQLAEADPSWSPDGTTVLFRASSDLGNVAIWRAAAGGGAPVELLADAAEPTWAPDGLAIAFVRTVSGAD